MRGGSAAPAAVVKTSAVGLSDLEQAPGIRSGGPVNEGGADLRTSRPAGAAGKAWDGSTAGTAAVAG